MSKHITGEELKMMLDGNKHIKVKGFNPYQLSNKATQGHVLPQEGKTTRAKPRSSKDGGLAKRSDGKETDLERSLRLWLLSEEQSGRVKDVEMQPKPPLNLAYRCGYTPDARCIRGNQIEYYEAKGKFLKQKYEDGWIKVKVAATIFQEFDFYLFEKIDGGFSLWWVPPLGEKQRKRQRLA